MTMVRWKRLLVAGLGSAVAAMLFAAGPAAAQVKYPSKPIEIVVPLLAGGGTDLLARQTAAYLSKRWGVPVNVVNKPGGQTIPAQLEVYKASKDGYTILGDGFTTSSVVELTAPNLPFKVLDRTFLGVTYTTPMLFMVNPQSPLQSLAAVVEDAKRNPQGFTWVSYGGISIQDFHMRKFFKAIGMDIRQTKPVLARGGAEVTTLIAGNHVKIGSNSPASIVAAHQAGLIKPIVISGAQRLPTLPDVPTFTEVSYAAVDASDWKGFSGPPGMPREAVLAWEQALEAMLSDPNSIKEAAKLGGLPNFRNSKDMEAQVKAEMEIAAELWKQQ